MATSDQADPDGPNSEEVLDERAILRAIDRAILDFNDDTHVQVVENLFLDSLANLCRLHGLPGPAGFLVFMGDEFQPLRRAGEDAGFGPVPVAPVLESFLDRENGTKNRLIEAGGNEAVFKSLGSTAGLIAPIYTPANYLLCLLVIAGNSREHLPLLRQLHLRQAVDDLTAQLTIAYRQFERAGRHAQMNELWAEFLTDNLSPSTCFRSLAQRISRFLPTFGPLGAVDKTPSTQILMLPGTADGVPPEHLVIRGMTGTVHSGTRVAIEDSISGLLIEEPDLPFFCDDPTDPKYEARYKNYFDDPDHQARTELAVRMNVGGRCVGIINIESRFEHAFSFLHQQNLLELADTFGQFAAVFEDRVLMSTEMQNSVATSTRNYLDALAKTYRHGIRTPLLTQKSNTYLLEEQIGDVEQWVAKALRRGIEPESPGDNETGIGETIQSLRETQSEVLTVHQEIARYSKAFIDDVSGYAVEEKLVLRDIVQSAIHLAYNCLLSGEAKRIKIEVSSDTSLDNTYIYCSTLIKQHLYSIFHNAVEATVARMKADGRPGRIAVSIAEEEIPKGQERDLNRAWIVRIRDNGLGVSEEQLAELRKFDPGKTFKSGGSGYGLVAAQRYVASIGGRIKLDSTEGEHFEVAIYFEAYNPDIHGEHGIAQGKDPD
jgi:signal transduction histidine kinase